MVTTMMDADIVLTTNGATGKRKFADLHSGQGSVASFEDYLAVGDGIADDTDKVQAAIDNAPPGGSILSFPGKRYRITSTITPLSKIHLKMNGSPYGDNLNPGANSLDSPTFLWDGPANGTMFNFRSCFNPSIIGFNFTSNGPAVNCCLLCDETGIGGVTGTAGFIKCNSFVNPTNNVNWKAISISPTSPVNQENYTIEENNFQGGPAQGASFSGKDIVGDGSKTISSPSNPWNAGQVGARIRLSWQVPESNTRGFIDDTIASFNSGTGKVTLTTNTVPNVPGGITCHVDQGYGIGVLIGDSQNSKHHKIIKNVSIGLQYGVVAIAGSFSIDHWNGEKDDWTVLYGYTIGGPNNMPQGTSAHMTEPCEIRFLESEGSIIGVQGAGCPLLIVNARVDNSKQDARGFFQLTDATIENTGRVTATPGPNQVLIGRNGGFGAAGNLITRGNIWGMTPRQVGITTWNSYEFGSSQADCLDQFDDSGMVRIIGAALRQGSILPSSPCPGAMQMFTDSNTGILGAKITGTGGFAVLAVYFDGSILGSPTGAWRVVAQLNV